MTPIQIHHARIMVEGGCTIEDVCVTLGLALRETIYAVAPALKANPQELKRVRGLLLGMRLPVPQTALAQSGNNPQESNITSVIHRRSRNVNRVKSRPDETRIAA